MHYSCRRPEFHSRAQAKGLIMPVTPASRRCDILFWPLQAPICAYIPPHTHTECFTCVYVCVPICVPGTHITQKATLDSLEPELQIFLSCHLDAGNQIQVLCIAFKCS